MIEFFTLMCEHPGVFFMVAVCVLIFIGMTYDFILRLFNRNGRKTVRGFNLDLDDDDDEPSEESPVVFPDDNPPS
jgi:hypothetical protein